MLFCTGQEETRTITGDGANRRYSVAERDTWECTGSKPVAASLSAGGMLPVDAGSHANSVGWTTPETGSDKGGKKQRWA